MGKEQKRKFIVVEDSYNYNGYWDYAMMEILPNGTLRNVIRGETEGAKNILNLGNSCSTKDALDIDLYVVDTEENLMYFEMDKIKKVKKGKYVFWKKLKIVLTFCKTSEHLKDKVIEQVCKMENIKAKDIVIEVKDTFILNDDEVSSLVKKFVGECDFNPATCELNGENLLSDNQEGVKVF